MVKQLKLGGQKIKTAYWSLVGTATAMMLTVQPMLAANDTIWTRFSTIMKDIYGQLVGISTIVFHNTVIRKDREDGGYSHQMRCCGYLMTKCLW